MEMIRTVVTVQLVLFSVERELSSANSVALAPDECSLIAGASHVKFRFIVAADDISENTILIGHTKTCDGTAKVNYRQCNTCFIFKYILSYLNTRFYYSKRRYFN